MIFEIIQLVARFIDDVSEKIGTAISWLTVAMVLITVAIVALRYVFNQGWIAMQESVTYLNATVFMLGAAYTLKNNGHVRVDIVYQRINTTGRAWIDLLGVALLLFPVCSFIVWSSWDYTQASWSIRESSREAGGLPGLFLLKTLIPMMAVLLILQGLAQALNCILTICRRTPITDN